MKRANEEVLVVLWVHHTLLIFISTWTEKSFRYIKISAHNLSIKRDKYGNIPREQRPCIACYEVEDEVNFLDYKNADNTECFIDPITGNDSANSHIKGNYNNKQTNK